MGVQSKGKDYGKYEPSNKLSLDDLQKYLDTHHPKDRKRVRDHIVPQFKSLMADAVQAAIDRLNPRKIDNCFEVFGFDFMIDANYRVWLIEVNTNPCFELCNAYLSHLIPKMLDEGLQLTVDRVLVQGRGSGLTALSDATQTAENCTGWERVYCSTAANAEEPS